MKLPNLVKELRGLLVVAAIIFPFRSSIADWNDVPTGSMNPTIVEGDRIAVNKLAYDLKIPFTTRHIATWGNPRRGEIVILYAPDNGMRLVKRVVGVPGDTLVLRDNRLTINGVAIDYRVHTAAAVAGDFIFAVEQLGAHAHWVQWMPFVDGAPPLHGSV